MPFTFQKLDRKRNVHKEMINVWVETFARMESHTMHTNVNTYRFVIMYQLN